MGKTLKKVGQISLLRKTFYMELNEMQKVERKISKESLKIAWVGRKKEGQLEESKTLFILALKY